MNDWSTLREGLKQEVTDAQGGAIEFDITQNELPPKRGIAVSARARNVIGLFCLWESGEADFDVMADETFTHHEMGMKLDERKDVRAAFANFLHKLAGAQR